MPRRHLLLSSSRTTGTGYLEHAAEHIEWLLGTTIKTVAFIPYAAVRFSWDEYESMVAAGIPGHRIVSVHRSKNPVDAIKNADAIAIGGGNTFQLVHLLYQFELMDLIRNRALGGIPFMGWSAGSNVAAPRLCTTNDMPIVEPASFQTLGLISSQINPHYFDHHPAGHMGETRAERITEFMALNPSTPVIGLREGAMLKVEGSEMMLEGSAGACVFQKREGSKAVETDDSGRVDFTPKEFARGADLSFLL